jgi:hypothetical protein
MGVGIPTCGATRPEEGGGLARLSGSGVGQWPQAGGVCAHDVSLNRGGWGLLTRGPPLQSRAAAVWIYFEFNFKTSLNPIQIVSNFANLENDLLELENFEIKYDFEDIENMNNFVHIIFFRFGRDLEWKSGKYLGLEFDII